MFVRLLLYIKHHFSFLWQIIEWLNTYLFRLFHALKFEKVVQDVIGKFGTGSFSFRTIEHIDLSALHLLISSQSPQRLQYFKPHGFDEISLQNAHKNPSFLMMGAFDDTRLVGYFFLRCFWNKKCFVGRIIDPSFEGKGIGKVMNDIMYNIAWKADFRCLSTISKNNQMVMHSHRNNKTMKVIKELPNDYLLVEFVKP